MPVFLKVAEHHNDLALKLPDHSPEFIHGSFKGGLCSYVGVTLFVALQRIQREQYYNLIPRPPPATTSFPGLPQLFSIACVC